MLLFVYPFMFFYYFLYYTDTVSILSLVLTYTLSAKQMKGEISPGLSFVVHQLMIFVVRKCYDYI